MLVRIVLTLVWLLLTLVASPFAALAAPSRVAVWNPQVGTKEMRFTLDPAQMDSAAKTLSDHGCDVARLTAVQIADPATFSASKYDVLILSGDTFPVQDVAAIKSFADSGGVLMALGTMVPFLIAIAPDADGLWTMSPQQPKFAWQRPDIMNLFGLQYLWRPTLNDIGVIHNPTPLLLKYLPDAKPIHNTLPSRWMVVHDGGQIFPLIQSMRSDGVAVTPQIYIVKKGSDVAIVSGEKFNTTGMPGFPAPSEVLPALVKIAVDIRHGTVALSPEMAVNLPGDLPSPPPLQSRVGTADTNPDGAQPIKRWGRFDGSSLDLPVSLADAVRQGTIPRTLAAGQSVTLSLPALPAGAYFFRLRGAYVKTGAGVCVESIGPDGKKVYWNELLNYIDTRGNSNHNDTIDLAPIEFNRVVYLPPMVSGEKLVLANTGSETLYLDAAQVETHKAPTALRFVGVGASVPYPDPSYTQKWCPIRMSLRTQFVGPPGDPDRWKVLDAKVNAALKANHGIQGILEGTPAWAAISPERLAEAQKANRASTVVPDVAKYTQLVTDLVQHFGNKIQNYEIWNEPDLQQYWRGSEDEYIALYKSVVPVIRKYDADAVVISGGLSGPNEAWARGMAEADAYPMANIVAFHPYAGKTPAWDARYGQIQGALLSCGIDKEIYCDECGFVYQNSEWFVAPPVYTPAIQEQLMDVACARLFASDVAKLQVFIAGPNSGPFDLFAKADVPRPAYAVIADYLTLAQNDGHVQDVSMTSPDATPLEGVYAAASSRPDGSATVVVNPAEVAALHPAPVPSFDFDSAGAWTTFYGKASASNGTVTVTPAAGKSYAGFYTDVSVNLDDTPMIAVDIPQADAGYNLVLKLPNGQSIPAATDQHGGVWTGDLRKLLPAGTKQFQLSFRVNGPTTFDSIHFSRDPAAPAPPVLAAPVVLVHLLVPLSTAGDYAATAACDDRPVSLKAQVKTFDGETYEDIALSVPGRTVISVTRQ